MYSGLSFILDIDGTLCPIKKKDEKYESLIPFSGMLEKLRYYKENGAKIILFTSRNMNSYNGNIGLINKNTAKILLEWLEKWEIPYDEIIYGKPWPGHDGFYVDDRSVRPDEFLKYTPQELRDICIKSKCDCIEQKRENIDIVITMGGSGSRFRKAGYEIPKYMIKVKGKTVFEWSMMSLDGFRGIAEKFIFIAMRDTEYDVGTFIKEQCKKLGITNYKVIILDYLTDGQATTAMLAEPYWNVHNGLLIYNIDTYVESGEMNSSQLHGDGYIPCFQAEGDHWSFVRVNDSGRVVEIREKERISDYCTIGAYYFKTCILFKELYSEFYADGKGLVYGEKYVAPLYNYLLEKGGEIFISNIQSKKVHVLGTPKELEAFRDL